MARAMWKGSIAFGLVNVPIELYKAQRAGTDRLPAASKTKKAPTRKRVA